MKTQNQEKNFFKRLSNTQKAILFLSIPLLGFSILPIILVLFIGLLPTITVLITDSKNINKLIIIGCFNLAGVFVYILNVAGDYSLNGAFNIISNIFNLIIMLGSAAIGAIIYCELPSLFAALSSITAKRKLESIEEKLSKLEEEWGREILVLEVPNTKKRRKAVVEEKQDEDESE